MKSLVEFLKESYEEELELKRATDYVWLSELLMFLDSNDEMNERRQVICDTFRHNYKGTLEDMKSSRVFQKFIDDLISLYNKYTDSNIKLNVTTRHRLENELASKMLVKINTEQNLPVPQEIESGLIS